MHGFGSMSGSVPAPDRSPAKMMLEIGKDFPQNRTRGFENRACLPDRAKRPFVPGLSGPTSGADL
jgi:hypothetical protein